MSNIIMEKYSDSFCPALFLAWISVTISKNEVISLKKEEKNKVDQEEEEKRYLLDLMKMQNEALKRIYKNTIDNEKKQ
jgi:predicted ATPase